MPIPAAISDLSVTPSLNSPQGTESAKGTIDDYLRAHAAFIKQTSDLVLGATVTLPSASLVSIGFAASSNVNITGTATISNFDTYAEGALRYVTFSGAMTLVNSGALGLPTAANITTVSGDSALFKSLGGGNWKCVMYQRLSGLGLTQASGSASGYLSAADFSAFAGKQAALGFVPVRQGGGAGQLANTVLIGWSGSGGLKAQVDGTDLGWVPFSTTELSAGTITFAGKTVAATAFSGNGSNLTGLTATQINSALGYAPQQALGFTPYNATNPAGYITGVTGTQITSALGYTPQPALGFTPANAAGQAFTGNISAPVVTQTSDERKKCNWRPLTDAQLDALASMELAGLFDWNEGGTSLGGSAQEIARIVPQAVHEDESGALTVNYGGLCFAVQQATLRRLWGKK